MAITDLLFSQATNADGPVEIVFGDDAAQPVSPPEKGELLFSQPSNPTSGPVEIVFGDDVDPGTPVDAVELRASGTITGLRGRIRATVATRLVAAGGITGLRGAIMLPYDVNVERPVAATARVGWQDTRPVRASAQQRFEQARPTYAAVQAVWQNAMLRSAVHNHRWQQAQQLAAIVHQALQQAQRVARAPTLQRFEQAQRLRVHTQQQLQQARPLVAAPTAQRFEDANLFYLQEHGLIKVRGQLATDGGLVYQGGSITAKGMDFLADDGGLSAILGVVTIKLHDDTIKALIEARILASNLPEPEKKRLIDRLRELRAETTKHLVLKLVDLGLDKSQEAIDLIGKALEKGFGG